MSKHSPPFTITNQALNLVSTISEALGSLSQQIEQKQNFHLRRINRIRTIQGSLAIEGNTLSLKQITAIVEGKRIIAPPREVQEAHNAMAAYEKLPTWQAYRHEDLWDAHKTLMIGLVEQAGVYRSGDVGVMSGKKVIHMAPQAHRVHSLMADLLQWLETTDTHPLITSCVFHYELEFIHPFTDGNGRMGRLWQSLILSQWHELFANLPVESLVHQHQKSYYQAISQSTEKTDSAPFIEFMLQMIMQAIADSSQESSKNTAQKTTQKTTQKQQEILQYLQKNPQASRKEIANAIDNITENGVKYNLKALQDKGLLFRVGSNRAGHWKVLV